MSLAKLRPVLYSGRCHVQLSALDRALAGCDAITLTGHYRSAELDISIRPAGIGGVPISARVSMFNIEHYFVRGEDGGEDGAIIEIRNVEDLHVVMFRA